MKEYLQGQLIKNPKCGISSKNIPIIKNGAIINSPSPQKKPNTFVIPLVSWWHWLCRTRPRCPPPPRKRPLAPRGKRKRPKRSGTASNVYLVIFWQMPCFSAPGNMAASPPAARPCRLGWRPPRSSGRTSPEMGDLICRRLGKWDTLSRRGKFLAKVEEGSLPKEEKKVF